MVLPASGGRDGVVPSFNHYSKILAGNRAFRFCKHCKEYLYTFLAKCPSNTNRGEPLIFDRQWPVVPSVPTGAVWIYEMVIRRYLFHGREGSSYLAPFAISASD